MTEPEVPKEPQNLEEPKSKLSTFLSHPAVATLNLIAAIIGLVGLPLSIYFYYAAKEYPQLTYHVHPVKATVVRAGEASRLTTSFDNKPLETDVTAAQLAIWNQGSQPIKRELVLRPVVISTENNVPFLEATIRRSSRDVTRLALNTDELQKGRVTVLWDILEQNDGGVVQLIYAGNPDVKINIDGVIEGQPQLERIEFKGRIKSPYEQYESGRLEYRYSGLLLAALSLLLVFSSLILRRLKAGYTKAADIYLEEVRLGRRMYERFIQWNNAFIEQNDKFIADIQKRIEGLEGEAVQPIIDRNQKWIEEYRKEQERHRAENEQSELKRQSALTDETKALRGKRQQERKYDLAILAVLLVGVISLIPAIYLLFIAQPMGPPFGF